MENNGVYTQGRVSVLLGTMHRSDVAHELGHNLGLQHTWQSGNYPSFVLSHTDRPQLIPQYTSKNIMDYRKSTDGNDFLRYFFKYQIEHLKK